MAYERREAKPRNDADDLALVQALEAHARGSVDVIVAIATQRNVRWEDALGAYPAAFRVAEQRLLDRLAKRKADR